MAGAGLTGRVRAWAAEGEVERFRDREIWVRRRPGAGPPLLLLHGFPSSSYDWRALLEALPGREALAFDFLGFGLSEKPRDHLYSLMWQADLVSELVGPAPRRRARVRGRPRHGHLGDDRVARS